MRSLGSVAAALRHPGGLRGYAEAMRSFSRNAWLYIVHVFGMDMIHGQASVIFNLYLLAVGFDLEFVGLRMLIASVASAVMAVPAGLISDRIGRKWSFLLGDGAGALLSLVNIHTTQPAVLLVTPVLGALFANLHRVAEPAFMAENSAPRERVHLFSVATGASTLAVMAGAYLAGYIPLLAASAAQRVDFYRKAYLIGIGVWFLSLWPAAALRERHPAGQGGKPAGEGLPGRRDPWRPSLRVIRHPGTVARIVISGALLDLGAGFAVPLFNVYFKEGLHAHEGHIGSTFASASLLLAAGALLAPFVGQRLGKVRGVVLTRMAAIPFILLLAYAPEAHRLGHVLGLHGLSAITVAGFAYVMRFVLQNMANPLAEAFQMEVLDPGERATTTGIEIAVGGALSGLGSFLGARLMAAGDFRTPLLVMAAAYALSNLAFLAFLDAYEAAARRRAPAHAHQAAGDRAGGGGTGAPAPHGRRG